MISSRTGKSSSIEFGFKQGFTLIELLVVIAIISILAAILFPVFSRARENARRTSCLSNMKQIGLGIMQYTQDFDERLPYQSGDLARNFSDTTAADWSPNWIHQIYPYVKSWQLFACPSATTGAPAPTATSDSSYLGNGVLLRSQTSRTLAAIPEVANIILAQEYALRSSTTYTRPDRSTTSTSYQHWSTDNYSNTHFDGGNLLFADGHAKWRKHSSICAGDFGLQDPASANACGTTIPAGSFAAAKF